MSESDVQKCEGIKIEPDMILTFDVLQWSAGWDFDHPTLILGPVIQYFVSGLDCDQAVDDACIDACADGVLRDESESFADECEWRGWKISTLKRRFAEALRGKEFPVVGYEAERITIRFYLDEEGELAFDSVDGP